MKNHSEKMHSESQRLSAFSIMGPGTGMSMTGKLAVLKECLKEEGHPHAANTCCSSKDWISKEATL